MVAVINHKAGDTFRREIAIDDPLGAIEVGMPVNATFVSGPIMITITATVIDDSGQLKAELSADATTTAEWSPRSYRGDVSFGTPATVVDSTETLILSVERSY